MELKTNALIYNIERTQNAILFDTYSAKKYFIPYEVATRAINGNLTDDGIQKLNSFLVDTPVCQNKPSGNLAHLRLLITNSCNFECIYCFAEHGSYGLPPHLMTKEVAKDAVDFFFNKYNCICQVSFFGGEPLLAIDIIEYICDYLSRFYKEKMPSFSLVTNGYLLNDDVVNILKRYNIAVMVSHDGPEFLHDEQRKLLNGGKTFSSVDRNLMRYRKDLNVGIEATYTSNHENKDISRSDLLEYFKTRYGITRASINDVDIEHDEQKYLVPSASGEYEQLFAFFESKGAFVTDYVYQLVLIYLTGYYCKTFCDAGLNQFTVDMDGNIYPCHRFVGNTKYILGTVNNSTVLDFNSAMITKESGHCSSCKYKLFCYACSYTMTYSKDICDNMQRCIKYFLEGMLNVLLNDREMYDQIIERCIDYGKRHRIRTASDFNAV